MIKDYSINHDITVSGGSSRASAMFMMVIDLGAVRIRPFNILLSCVALIPICLANSF